MEPNFELVNQLASIVGVEYEEAKILMVKSKNNLHVAINSYLEKQQGANSKDPEDDVRAPIPQKMEMLVSRKSSYVGPLTSASHGPKLVYDSLRDFGEETKLQEALLRGDDASSFSCSSRYAVKSLGMLFRPPYDLMFAGSFEAACDHAVKNKKWLIANIHNPSEFTSQVVNRDVWSDDNVKTIVKKHFVLWSVSHCSQDGVKFMQFYTVNEWPYIAVLDPVTRAKIADFHTTDSDAFKTKADKFLSKYDASSDDWRKESTKKRRLSEDEGIERAIQASLAESVTEQEQSDEDSDCLETFESSDSDIDYSLPVTTPHSKPLIGRKVRRIMSPVIETIPSCDERPVTTPPSKDQGTELTLRLKLPTGEMVKMETRTLSTISDLLSHVNSIGYSSKEYRILATFPRRIVSNYPLTQTLEQSEFKVQEILYIEKL